MDQSDQSTPPEPILSSESPDDANSLIPIDPSPPTPVPTLVAEDVYCARCSYNLHGLSTLAHCPECGTPVRISVEGRGLLAYAPAEYLAELIAGIKLVLLSVLLTLALVATLLLGLGLTVLKPHYPNIGFLQNLDTTIERVADPAMLLPSLLSIWGYWRFTTPDPGYTSTELPSAARNVLRITTLFILGCALVSTVASVSALSGLGGATPPATTPAAASFGSWALVGLVVDIAATIAGAVLFFAAMSYIRWLGSRVPDQQIVERAKTYRWLLPVIYVFGCGIGTLIAPVAYWLFLNKLRKRLIIIRNEQQAHLAAILGSPPRSTPDFT